MIIGVAVKFDAAHYLPGYNGKCANMHGHTWHVEVEVCGDVDEKTGMVMDLAILKREVNTIIDKFDHQVLNDLDYLQAYSFNIAEHPTCENLAQFIHDQLVARYNIQSVKVREGEGGWAQL